METLGNARVQYGDMRGTAALDFHGGSILDLAHHIGARGFPVAIEIDPGLDAKTMEHFLLVAVYATDVAAGADDVMKYAREHENKIPAKRYAGRVTLQEFSRFVKRFEVVLRSKVAMNAEIEYEYASDDDGE
jgi:hypothetical protein